MTNYMEELWLLEACIGESTVSFFEILTNNFSVPSFNVHCLSNFETDMWCYLTILEIIVPLAP